MQNFDIKNDIETLKIDSEIDLSIFLKTQRVDENCPKALKEFIHELLIDCKEHFSNQKFRKEVSKISDKARNLQEKLDGINTELDELLEDFEGVIEEDMYAE